MSTYASLVGAGSRDIVTGRGVTPSLKLLLELFLKVGVVENYADEPVL